MSLEELLKEADSSSPWKFQQKKLLRITVGALIMFGALVTTSLLLSSEKKGDVVVTKPTDDLDREDENAAALAQLMKLRDEAHELKATLAKLENKRQEMEIESTRVQSTAVRKQIPMQTPPTQNSRVIMSFDPGDGFLSLEREKESKYIPTGSVFQARLITPIKTSVERTFVMAEVTQEFRMDFERRIPKGSRLIGRSRLNPVLRGVIVEFETLVLPDGRETRLDSLALSRDALPEIDGLYFSDKLQTYGSALAFGFLSGLSDAGRRRRPGIIGDYVEDTLSNQVLAGLSTATFQIAEELLRDIDRRSVEYVVVPSGEPIFVVLTRRYEVN